MTDEQKAALIALGWRAPGPPTPEAVERAATFLMSDLSGCKWEDAEEGAREVHRTLARAALTAALTAPA